MEASLLQRWSGSRLLLGSLILGLLGAGPLLLYIAFGPADGNPIGLGLLAIVTLPFACAGAIVGLIKLAVQRFSRGGA
jgi:hypothetical protein